MTRKESIEFYRKYSGRLYNTALRILGDPQDAEEVMQDTILKYFTRLSRPENEPQVSAWLLTTCRRRAIDRLRERKRRDIFLADYAGECTEIADIPTLSVTKIQQALSRLDDPYRLILILVLIEGLDYGEISALTGKKEVTLRSLYSRGKARLSRILEEYE